MIQLAGLDPDVLRARLGRMTRALLPVACGFVVVIFPLLAWYLSWTDRSPTVHNVPPLGMGISTPGDSFLLTWDLNNSAVKQASDGVLHILDGGTRRDIALNTQQVHTGSVLYHPQSGDITFDLELHRSGAMLGFESIRMVDGSKHLVAEGSISPASSAPAPTPRVTTSKRARRHSLVPSRRHSSNRRSHHDSDAKPAKH
jgi:hypothetical protein